MTAYIYQADVWCEHCADEIMAVIRANHPELVPEDYMDHGSYESDDWPKSYSPDHNESDSPENCAHCGAFLYGALTTDGYVYLKSMLDEHGATLPPLAREWADYFGCEECECESPSFISEWRSNEMD